MAAMRFAKRQQTEAGPFLLLLCYMLKHSSYVYVTAKTIGICLWVDQVLFCMNVLGRLCPIFCDYCGIPKTVIDVKYFVIILSLL